MKKNFRRIIFICILIVAVIVSYYLFRWHCTSSDNKRLIYVLAFFQKIDNSNGKIDLIFTYNYNNQMHNEVIEAHNFQFAKNEAIIICFDSVYNQFRKPLTYRIENQNDCVNLANKQWNSFPIRELIVNYDENMY
jgi:hypothetical protein